MWRSYITIAERSLLLKSASSQYVPRNNSDAYSNEAYPNIEGVQ